ncbi:MAG: ATP-binding protein [Candidatus Limiplasma sp.]|nr:ATP-binding protein [Candidatus Limiplasma sp.]
MIVWTIFEIGINLFQGLLIIYFLNKQLISSRSHRIADAVCTTFITLFLTAQLFIDMPVASDTVMFIFPIVYGFIVFDDRWHMILFWNIITLLVFTVVVNLTSSFYLGVINTSWEQLLNTTPERVGFIVSTNLLMLIFMITIIELTSRTRSVKLSWYSFSLLLGLNMVCLTAIELLFAIGMDADLGERFTSVCLCLFVISILSIILYEMMAKSAYKQGQYELEINRLELTQKYNNEMQSVYEDIAVFRHDIKHHMQIIEQMSTDKESAEIYKHIDMLNDRFRIIQPYSTGNVAVDALLTAKASIIRRRNISFAFQGYPLIQLPVQEDAFCSLLGNILDNATEGVDRLDNKESAYISLTFARTWDMFYMTCENTYNPSTVKKIGGRLISSKNGSGHGLGTRSINATVKEAHGTAEYSLAGNVFRVTVIIPCNTLEI